MTLIETRKKYRTVGLTVFIIAVALLVMRIVSYYVQVATIDSTMDEAWLMLLYDVIFSVPVQLGVLLLFPFLMYKFSLKKSFSGVLEFSGCRKCSPWICLLAVPLGGFFVVISMGVSTVWQVILMMFGYTPSSGGAMPETFNALYFIASVILTAVLPGICEEFTNRGGMLTVFRTAFSKRKAVLLVAIAFGLFHQNITQVVYTAVFGAVLAYVTIETGSVFPAMIMHFMNNFMSVLIDNATTYNWAIGGGLYDFLNNASLGVLVSIFTLCLLAVFGLLIAIVYIARKKRKADVYGELAAESALCGFKPSVRDNMFFIGAIVVTAVATVLTFSFRV